VLKTLRETEPLVHRGQAALVNRPARIVLDLGPWKVEWPAAKTLFDLVDATAPTGGPPYLLALATKKERQN